MRRRSGWVLLAIVAAATTACAEIKGLILPGGGSAPPASQATTPYSRTVTGQVRATPGLTVQAVSQSALVGAEVYLADGTGKPLPAMTTRTNEQGRYVFTGVPVGYTFLVVAKTRANGKEALLQSIVHTTEAGSVADVDATTTLVSVGVLQDMGEALGKFDPENYKRAVAKAASQVNPGELPDFADRAAVKAKIEALQAGATDLRAAVELMRIELKDAKVSLADVKTQLAKREADLAAIATAITSRPADTATTKASPKPSTSPAPSDATAFAELSYFVFPGKFQSNDYPVNVEFRKKGTDEVTTKFLLKADNEPVKTPVLQASAHDIWVSTQRSSEFKQYWGGFVVTQTTADVALPFAAKENPLVSHTFKMPAAKFAEADYPVQVQLREKDGALVIADLEFETAADKPTGKLRHGMEYDLWVTTKTKLKAEAMWKGWAVSEKAASELELPFQ